MNRQVFNTRMEKIDAQLQYEGVAIHQRQWPAFRSLAPGYHGPLFGPRDAESACNEFEGPRLFRNIGNWYRSRYGERFVPPYDRGRVPIQLRGEIYAIRIPLAFGSPKVDVLRLVEGVTEDMLRSLTRSECNEIGSAFADGYQLICEVEDMVGSCLQHPTEGSRFNPKTTRLIERSVEDRNTAAECLERQRDLNGACFLVQQSAEKMMKAFLLAKGVSESQVRSLQHRMMDALKECSRIAPRFGDVATDVGLLSNVRMSIRYDGTVAPEHAVAAFWASVRVTGLAATQISGQERRFGRGGGEAVDIEIDCAR